MIPEWRIRYAQYRFVYKVYQRLAQERHDAYVRFEAVSDWHFFKKKKAADAFFRAADRQNLMQDVLNEAHDLFYEALRSNRHIDELKTHTMEA